MQNKTKKLLILDGIGGVPLGREMHEAIRAQGVDASYYDCAQLPKISLYGLKSAIAKLINRADKENAFYHLPRLHLAAFKQLIAKEQPTHVLVIGFIYKFIAPQILLQLKAQHHFSLCLYDTDSCNLYAKRREFIFFLAHELPAYDAIFTFSKVTTRFFKETKNLNAIHFPFGAKPLPSRTQRNQKQQVLFVGSCDLRRIFLLEHIKDNVLVFGNRWDRNRPFISAQLQSKINDTAIWGDALYAQLLDAKIVLNITRTHFYGAETGINLRIFEALAAGCFLLTDYCDEVAELFVIGEEIEVFRSANELREKVDYYLAHPIEREAMARRGHEKFLKSYTWQSRVQELSLRMQLTTAK